MNSWQIGKVRVSQVVEMGPVPTSPKFFFKDPPADLVARCGFLRHRGGRHRRAPR